MHSRPARSAGRKEREFDIPGKNSIYRANRIEGLTGAEREAMI
jgi:hypothetical protein